MNVFSLYATEAVAATLGPSPGSTRVLKSEAIRDQKWLMANE